MLSINLHWVESFLKVQNVSYVNSIYTYCCVFYRHSANIIQLLPLRKCTEENVNFMLHIWERFTDEETGNLAASSSYGDLVSAVSQGQTQSQSLQNLVMPQYYLGVF